MRTRFAPSPTGYLHLGHAAAAREAFGYAAARGGECLLRVEDIDTVRCKPYFTQALYEDLRWLGFDWPQPVRVQSAHMGEYRAALESLRGRGLVYRCFKTRKDLPSGIYRGPDQPVSEAEAARRMAAGEHAAWRLSMARAKDALGARFDDLSYTEAGQNSCADLSGFGDEVLARKDIGVSYHLAVTHDDACQNITHVVRGNDLRDMTPFHVLLQALMGWPVPEYYHHDLVLRPDGAKLSKRTSDTAIRALREAGMSAQDMLASI